MDKLAKVRLFLKKYWVHGLLIIVLGAFVYTQLPQISKTIETKTIASIADKPAQECTPVETLVLSDSLMADKMNIFFADLNNYTVMSSEIVTSYHTKEKIFGVKREMIPKSKGATQVYLVIYEPVDKLNWNKKEYERIQKVEGK